MGDLKGHIIPGTFFLIFGLWWAVNILIRHFACQRGGTRLISTSTFKMDYCKGRVGRLPVEGFAKIIVSVGYMLGELLAHLPVPPSDIVGRATMYFFFLLSGAVDVAMHYGIPLPPSTDFLSLMATFVIEGLLLVTQFQDRGDLESHVHMLLAYVIFATAFVLALEAKIRSSTILSLTRAYLSVLQGTWFCGVGIILYGHGENNPWDPYGHNLLKATIYFSWHCAANLVLFILLAVSVSYFHRKCSHNFPPTFQMTEERLPVLPTRSRNGEYGILSIEDSDDFETEFDKRDETEFVNS